MKGCAALAVSMMLAACSFDGGGIADDDVGIDANEGPDRDSDGVPDRDDNCPGEANAGQEDEDGDDRGNVCDNCPSVANADQANDGESVAGEAPDDAGDACDPDPDGPGNDLVYFAGFDDAGAIDDWRVFGGGSWSIADGTLRQTATNTPVATLYLANMQLGGVFIETSFTLDSVPGTPGPKSFGTITHFASGPNTGAGYYCTAIADPTSVDNGALEIQTMRGSQSAQVEDTVDLGDTLEVGARYDLAQSTQPATDELTCGIASTSLPGGVSASGNDNTYATGFVALRTGTAAGQFHYVVVYALP